jgi:hypothetical protein
MKRIKKIAVVLFAALLCFAVTAMAGESSFYDTTNNWIVRAYTESTPTAGIYSIFVEILDEDGDYFAPTSDILLNGQALSANPLLIDANQVTDEVSIAYKYVAGGTEIFVFGDETGVPGQIHNNRILSKNNPVAPANISVSGNGVFGDVDVDATPPTKAITVSNTGVANLILGNISVTGTGFSQVAGGCTDGQTLTQGQNCIVTVQFDPTTQGAYVGNLSIPSNDIDTPTASVTLSGTGEAAPPTGNADITFPLYVGLNAQTSVENNQIFSVTAKVVNSGTAASGPFVVKLYFSTNKIPGDSNDILLSTWSVSQLNPGQTLTYIFSNLRVTGAAIHQTYYLVAHADANNDVGETNENNNIFTRTITISR